MAFRLLFWLALSAGAGTFEKPRAVPNQPFLAELIRPLSSSSLNWGSVHPNELNPERALPLLQKAPAGLYAGVGSERVWIGAALAPRTTHVIFIDRNPTIVRYNRTNGALFQLAETLEEYKQLRLNASWNEWNSLLQSRGESLPAETREVLASRSNYLEWREIQEANPLSFYSETMFAGSNYLKVPPLFSRLQRLAKRQRIRSVELDLEDRKAVAALAQALKKTNVPLGVLDLSNIPYGYMGGNGMLQLLRSFSTIATEDSLLMSTQMLGPDWFYSGLRFGDMTSRGLEKGEGALRRFFSFP
ncbi:MAG: hypothetical protein KGK30_07360, partial [Elusimicrobia bacterium]|nr:hypothetical protein [Elusimicrobiota bacterium]